MIGVSSATGSSPSSTFSALVIAASVLMRADNSRYTSCTASVSHSVGPSMPRGILLGCMMHSFPGLGKRKVMGRKGRQSYP